MSTTYTLARQIAKFIDERNHFNWSAYGLTEQSNTRFYWHRVKAVDEALQSKQGRLDIVNGLYDARSMNWIPKSEFCKFIDTITVINMDI